MNARAHGERRRVVGKAKKTGRMWTALMCPDKAASCDPQWIADKDVFEAWKAHAEDGWQAAVDGLGPPVDGDEHGAILRLMITIR